jgi:DNA-binding CsgD family transcriptional regulator
MPSRGSAPARRATVQWTQRQRDVLDLLTKGYTNPQIAEAMGISLDGDKWHVSEVMSKLGVHAREEAADYWRREGRVDRRVMRTLAALPAAVLLRWATAAVAVALLAGLGILVAARVGEDDAPQSPGDVTPTSTAGSGVPTATAPTTPVGTATATVETIPSTLRLVEAETGSVTTLMEMYDDSMWDAGFTVDGDSVIARWGGSAEIGFDGTVLAEGVMCEDVGDSVMIGGREYADIECGDISPNRRWMLYEERVNDGFSITGDAWLLEIATGERVLVHEDLVHCGGCDWGVGHSWSPSGTFILLAEFGGGGRLFLTDTQDMNTELISSEGGGRDRQPDWSPAGDQLLIASGGMSAVIDAGSGARRELPIPWPARWDVTGTYFYSPAWPVPGGVQTTIYDAGSAVVVDIIEGMPSETAFWNGTRNVAAIPGGGYTAVLENVPGCNGTTIHSTLRDSPGCLETAFGAAVAPGGELVAVALLRQWGTGLYRTPRSDHPRPLARYDIVIVDVATGAPRVVGSGYGAEYRGEESGPYPPSITWNESGSHFIVRWPATYGI